MKHFLASHTMRCEDYHGYSALLRVRLCVGPASDTLLLEPLPVIALDTSQLYFILYSGEKGCETMAI
ncbi:MAG: hypothetical protein JMM76_02215 [Candidatus Xiphinematobacter sp.]|nr:MAG: hypothetical protein JMM76_02215 [Candidatus Xiphinematobacter sp.]